MLSPRASAGFSATALLVAANACGTSGDSLFDSGGTGTGEGGQGGRSASTGSKAEGGRSSSSSSTNSHGSGTATGGSGGGGSGGSLPSVCDLDCGAEELCDPLHRGTDDDCDGRIDEGCACRPGQQQACFKGNPKYRSVAGCFDGVQTCKPDGTWAPCVGGVHATAADECWAPKAGCHALGTPIFAPVSLKTGLGTFGDDAKPGSETWEVTCPPGTSPCPLASADGGYKPVFGGEYRVTYTKEGAAGAKQSCSFPVIVQSRGLRTELLWEHDPDDQGGVDLDLHLHAPNDDDPWHMASAAPSDCNFTNCEQRDFELALGDEPEWFDEPPTTPPAPVNWWLDPVAANNSCYYAPRGAGKPWKTFGHGCHNPRLETDVIECAATDLDPDSATFCTPETVAVDFPSEGEWFRVGVFYYDRHVVASDIHPRVRFFCDGAPAADLGPLGYKTPVTFTPEDGDTFQNNTFWEVADVIFERDACGKLHCSVRPIYASQVQRTPYFTTQKNAEIEFVPEYPDGP